MKNEQAPSFFNIAFDRSVVMRSSRIALVVGSIIALINHGDRLFTGQIDAVMLAKIGLTFLVPYCVSTYSSVCAVRDRMQTIEPTDES